MWVAKLGGSLHGSTALERWLETLATAGAGKVVVVPGGGQWADEVRRAQQREDFDEGTAHRMALRAMEQYGRVLVRSQPGLVAASDVGSMLDALDRGAVPVWMPHQMAANESAIPESWDVTSDSLAAWLACQLDADVLALIKSLDNVDPQPSVANMVERGWVDRAFPRFAAGARQIRMFARTDWSAAGAELMAMRA